MLPNHQVGFMQGRLSPIVNGLIQSFPWGNWREEITEASAMGIHLMEWTLDQDNLYKNPLLVEQSQQEIITLLEKHNFSILSLTGDCFMQSPFWKADEKAREELKENFVSIARACAKVGIKMIVVPLVDNGSLENNEQENELISFLNENQLLFEKLDLKVIFESDFGPKELARFISRLDEKTFGINYDTGNSAALGYDPKEEINAYGPRILNVHIKDRLYQGTTVALGTGATDFEAVFAALAEVGYDGNYILQTARAEDDDHAGVLKKYRDMTVDWIESNGA